MPQVTIDDRTYDYEGEHKLLQFCLDRGIELPHFCYHPAMSIPTNCRQCYVEVGSPAKDRETGKLERDENGEPVINFMPKLQTSCSINVNDGMMVRTHRTSDKVDQAQADNLEFLLINHPLDCPICDQAGHCPLQIQSYKYGPEGSRFEFRKVHKPKRVKLGPNVILDAERCINCTRCTRFTDEVSGSHQLTIIDRGVENYPLTAPGETFDEPYSMNVIDVCPVGALTSADARFQAREWEMSKTPSITVSNAKGANCFYHVRDNIVLRVSARDNPHVNDYWLADEDRLDYKRFNDDRAGGPQLRAADETFMEASWEKVYSRAAAILDKRGSDTLFLGSAHATVESNYLLMQLAEAVGADPPEYIPHIEPGAGDDWLITDDKTPNSQGCERLGIRPVDEEVVRARLRSGEIRALYVLEDDPVASEVFSVDDLRGVPVILHHYHTTNSTLEAADVALPAAMVVETIGTYVNEEGHSQRVRPCKAIRGVNRTLMMEMGQSRQDRHGTPFDRWHNESHQIDCKPGWDTLPAIMRLAGLDPEHTEPKAIMNYLSETNPAFAGATYDEMSLEGVRLKDIGEPA